jgi:hypothetical protein
MSKTMGLRTEDYALEIENPDDVCPRVKQRFWRVAFGLSTITSCNVALQ